MVDVCEDDIREVISRDKSFGDYMKHKLMPVSDKPVGFSADHYMLHIFLEPSIVRNYFLKAVPRNIAKRVEYLEETGFFAKEVNFYQNLMPKLLQFSSLSWAPECYHAKCKGWILHHSRGS